MENKPVLYSFRRCPFAMRARLALAVSGVEVEHREVMLKAKPVSMLEYSPKGTVPVLVLGDSEVIEESLDIMLWALGKCDPDNFLPIDDSENLAFALELIEENDIEFKQWLDRYKYADRYLENSKEYYREQGLVFIWRLDGLLAERGYLGGGGFEFS